MYRIASVIVVLSFIVSTASAQTDSISIQINKHKSKKEKLVNGSPMAANLNIIQNVSKAKDYSVLLKALKATGLIQTFESKGPITIFAPTNMAFAKLPGGKLDTLLKPEHKFELSSLLTYHAISGKVSAKDISRNIREHKGSATYLTLAGSKIIATIDANRNIVLTDENGGQCVISQFDVEQSNGMLHVVNSVFIPKTRMI